MKPAHAYFAAVLMIGASVLTGCKGTCCGGKQSSGCCNAAPCCSAPAHPQGCPCESCGPQYPAGPYDGHGLQPLPLEPSAPQPPHVAPQGEHALGPDFGTYSR